MTEIVTTGSVDAGGASYWASCGQEVAHAWGELLPIQRHAVNENVTLPVLTAAAPFIAEAVLLDLLQQVKDPRARETIERAAYGYHQEQGRP